MNRHFVLGLSIAMLLSPAIATAEESDHLSKLGELSAVHAWARATDGRETFVFLELRNEGETTVTLDGAETPVAATAGIVGLNSRPEKPSTSQFPLFRSIPDGSYTWRRTASRSALRVWQRLSP